MKSFNITLRIGQKLLQQALDNCPQHEALMQKALKIYERVGDLNTARQLLSQLRASRPDRVWRLMLEGAMMEGRAGNDAVARRVFKVWMMFRCLFLVLLARCYKM